MRRRAARERTGPALPFLEFNYRTRRACASELAKEIGDGAAELSSLGRLGALQARAQRMRYEVLLGGGSRAQTAPKSESADDGEADDADDCYVEIHAGAGSPPEGALPLAVDSRTCSAQAARRAATGVPCCCACTVAGLQARAWRVRAHMPRMCRHRADPRCLSFGRVTVALWRWGIPIDHGARVRHACARLGAGGARRAPPCAHLPI